MQATARDGQRSSGVDVNAAGERSEPDSPVRPRTSLAMAAVASGAVLAIWLGNGVGAPSAAAAPADGGAMPGMSMAGAVSTGSRLDAACPAPGPSPAVSPFTEQLPVPQRIDVRAGGTAKLVM